MYGIIVPITDIKNLYPDKFYDILNKNRDNYMDETDLENDLNELTIDYFIRKTENISIIYEDFKIIFYIPTNNNEIDYIEYVKLNFDSFLNINVILKENYTPKLYKK